MSYADDLAKEYIKQMKSNIKLMNERIKTLYQQAIQESVYDYYQPTVEYERSFELLNSINVEVKDGKLYIYEDINDMYYESAVDGRLTSSIVPYLVQEGHSDGIGEQVNKKNQYHNYEGRHYLERAKELIEKEFPNFEVEIINDVPKLI